MTRLELFNNIDSQNFIFDKKSNVKLNLQLSRYITQICILRFKVVDFLEFVIVFQQI